MMVLVHHTKLRENNKKNTYDIYKKNIHKKPQSKYMGY